MSANTFFDYQLYIFDFDNTLYAERDYLFAAYQQIEIVLNTKGLADFLKSEFDNHGREKLFNKLIKRFSLSESEIEKCLYVLRTVQLSSPLLFIPGTVTLLNILRTQSKTLVLLTNGNVLQQKNKLQQLETDIYQWFEEVVFANEIAPKPAAESVFYILKKTNISASAAILIGDSDVDKLAAQNAGIAFLHADNLPR